jgi:hypothetical protein
VLAARASGRVAAVFVAWMQAVEAGGRRPMRVGAVDCGAMWEDEARLVLACGLAATASQISVELLEPLVHEPESVTVLAASLSAALAAAGWALPVRPPPYPGRNATPTRLH